MNDETLITLLKQLHSVEPRGDVIDAIRASVFSAVSKENQTLAPRRFPVSWLLAPAGATFALLLVVVNQIPMNNSYQDSITAIADASYASVQLQQNGDAESVRTLSEKVRVANETVATLNLEGAFGSYTQEQCLNAHRIFDRYLDSAEGDVSRHIANSSDPEIRAALEELQNVIQIAHENIESRIDMYPPDTR